MILMIDNYDSFTYNLVQLIGEMVPDLVIRRNDEITLDEIRQMKPQKIIFSPGPGRPEDAGNMERIIQTFYQTIPMLGICLGHQAITQVLGGSVTYAPRLFHGKPSQILTSAHSRQPLPLKECVLFSGLPEAFQAARYHSLIADPETLPDDLQITACTDQQEIMAVQHKDYPVYGLQFHPESILTEYGKEILHNFLQLPDAADTQ